MSCEKTVKGKRQTANGASPQPSEASSSRTKSEITEAKPSKSPPCTVYRVPCATEQSKIKNQKSKITLPTAYAPNTAYISAIAHSERFSINIEEPYIRQTFRNRCEILTSQGVQKLSIPIDKKSTRSGMIKDTKIDYAENWQRQHWRSLQASYSNSPYFLYYQDELQVFYEKRYAFLVDFNFEILAFILKKIGCEVRGTRCEMHQKTTQYPVPSTQYPSYQQVFNPKKFVPNLSSFDLLFNCGPESKSYLCKA